MGEEDLRVFSLILITKMMLPFRISIVTNYLKELTGDGVPLSIYQPLTGPPPSGPCPGQHAGRGFFPLNDSGANLNHLGGNYKYFIVVNIYSRYCLRQVASSHPIKSGAAVVEVWFNRVFLAASLLQKLLFVSCGSENETKLGNHKRNSHQTRTDAA